MAKETDRTIRVSDDDVFAWIFGRESQKKSLLSLINAVLSDADFPKIVDLRLVNPFSIKSYESDKNPILDILAEDEEQKLYDIEMQSYNEAYHSQRLLYYWARMYANQLKSGEKYSTLRPAIAISFLRTEHFPQYSKQHSCFLAIEKDNPHYGLNDHLQLHIIELVKKKAVKPQEELAVWIEYIKNAGEKDMTFLEKSYPSIREAQEAYGEFKRNSDLTKEHWSRIERKRSYEDQMVDAVNHAMEKGIEKGMEKGIEKGIEKGAHANAIETAQKFLKMGLSLPQVMEGTGLSKKEIEELGRRS